MDSTQRELTLSWNHQQSLMHFVYKLAPSSLLVQHAKRGSERARERERERAKNQQTNFAFSRIKERAMNGARNITIIIMMMIEEEYTFTDTILTFDWRTLCTMS